MSEAKQIRNHYAVVLCRVLSDYKYFESVPENASADVPENAPEDSPADIFPVMSAKCKLCPSCVDGRCFFVPDIYDSEFPCQSSAWDDFFKSGGSRSPAPRARASPL